MRVLYFGTSPFAVPALEALLASRHEVIGVVTQPDRPTGRGLQLSSSPVKKATLELAPGLPIIQPEKARVRAFREQVEAMAPDVLVVAAFGQILTQRLLDGPRYGGINIHGSLLPRWRGAAPLQYCLIAGDTETGVTTMQMDAGMDTGDMLLQSRRPIESDDTVESLERKLSVDGASLTLETLGRLERGDCPRTPQDSALVTYAPSLPPDIGYIDFNKPAHDIVNLVRGVSPKPGAFVAFGGRRVKIWQAAVDKPLSVPDGLSTGEVAIMDAMGIIVLAGSHTTVRISEVQPESKGRMRAADWARGARLSSGARLERPASTPRDV